MCSRMTHLATAALLVALTSTSWGQVKLLSVTGQVGDDDQTSFPDQTLFEIDLETAEPTFLKNLTYVPEAHVVSYNTNNGLLYHSAGAESWTNDPNRSGGIGFRDRQYLESYTVSFGEGGELQLGEANPIFNANPCPSPDELPCFGLDAPRPTWVNPSEVRLIDQTDQSYREPGENEYHAIRGLAFSAEENLWYATDEDGYFKLTPDGQSTWLGPDPRDGAPDPKGIGFYTNGEGETLLLSGHRRNGTISIINPADGTTIDEITPEVPEGSLYDLDFGGLYAMIQHPETGVVYGLRNPDQDDPFARELITLNPETGETTFIGELGLHFTSLTFVYPVNPSDPCDFDGDGSIGAGDADELTAAIAGGTTDLKYDADNSGTVDGADIVAWLHDCAGTWVGDVDFDGLFDSNDLITVAAALTYEADVDAVYTTGDFTGDGRFTPDDLITAAADLGYEAGPYTGVAAVPEPSALVLLVLGALALVARRR